MATKMEPNQALQAAPGVTACAAGHLAALAPRHLSAQAAPPSAVAELESLGESTCELYNGCI